MPKVTERIYGAPCWVDLTTRRFEDSKAFYTALFGWDYTDMGPEFGNYNIISKDGDYVGGAMAFNGEFMPAETPDAWGVYFSVEDINATLAAMKDKGGMPIMEPMQVGDQGSNVFLIDPQQSAVGLWQPMELRGFGRYGEPGFPAWFELHTRNFDEAVDFYTSTLGVERGEEPMEGMRYATLNVSGEPHSGVMDATEMMQPGQPNAWLVYFLVENTEEAIAKIQELGGTVLVPAMDSPYGRMAVIADPVGVVFNIIDGNETPD